MRITNGMISSQYTRNLNNSLSNFNYHTTRSTNFRRFNRASEDPIAAARAFSLRRSYLRNENYLQNSLDATDFMKTADTALQSLVKITTDAGSEDCLQAVNGTQTEQERRSVATKLRKMQETIISQANTQYGERYVFGGTTTTSPPFTVGEDGTLFYKDVNVTTGEHKGLAGKSAKANLNSATIDFGADNGNLLNGYSVSVKEPSVPADPLEVNGIDPLTKQITIFLEKADANAPNLQAALQGLTAPTPPVTIPPTRQMDMSKITVTPGITGSVLQGSTETSGGVDAIIAGKKGTPATSSKANLNGATIDFGSANGDLLNDYTISVKEPSVPVNPLEVNGIDPVTKEITIFLKKADANDTNLQTALQGLTAPTAVPPAREMDMSQITVSASTTGSDLQGAVKASGGAEEVPSTGTIVNLNKLAQENMFVDLGLGLEFNGQNLNKQSAFDMSMPGISFLGYGVDNNGDPKNMYVLLGEIATKLENGDSTFNFKDTMKSITAFQTAQNTLITKETEIGAKQNFIDYAKTRLDDAKLTLNEKILNVEQVKPEEAITDFKMAEFTYMATLQMGSKIIQPSFLDYMT